MSQPRPLDLPEIVAAAPWWVEWDVDWFMQQCELDPESARRSWRQRDMTYEPTELRPGHAQAPDIDELRRTWQLIAGSEDIVMVVANATRAEAMALAAQWSYAQRRWAEVEPYDIPVLAYNEDGELLLGGR